MGEEHGILILAFEEGDGLDSLLVGERLFGDDAPDPEKVELFVFSVVFETGEEHGRVAVAGDQFELALRSYLQLVW